MGFYRGGFQQVGFPSKTLVGDVAEFVGEFVGPL